VVESKRQIKTAWWAETRDTIIPLATDPEALAVNYPLYFVHSISGAGGAEFTTLAAMLSPEIPFFAFQVPHPERTGGTGQSLIDMATRYRNALIEYHHAHYGDTPFYLGGWSAGVMVALEMAQQLTQMGQAPARLVAIDKCPRHTKAEIGPWNGTPRNVYLWLKRSWRNRTSLGGAIGSLAGKLWLIVRQRQLYGGPDSVYDSQAVINRILLGKPADEAAFISAFYQQTCGYVPQRYAGSAVLVVVSDHGRRDRVAEGWRYIALDRKIVRLRGTTHKGLVLGEKNDFGPVRRLATVLRRELISSASTRPRARFGLASQSPRWLDQLGGM
jgi:thioesterase domain-containing protein